VKSSIHWQQYVPSIKIEAVAHSSNNIIGTDNRIYLPPSIVTINCTFHVDDGKKVNVEKFFDIEHLLYLGSAPLQRIVSEMRALSSSCSDNCDHVTQTVRPCLFSYCDYIHGEAENCLDVISGENPEFTVK
jgi:hypothetical protein